MKLSIGLVLDSKSPRPNNFSRSFPENPVSRPTICILQVELTKCGISVMTLFRVWQVEGVTEDNRLLTSWGELLLYPIPALLYLVKNMLQVKHSQQSP